MKTFLDSLNQKILKKNIIWKISKDNINFFNECVSILNKFNLKTVLDISCGKGNFISLCLKNNIEGYGVDPIDNPNKRIYKGTYSSIIENSKLLGDYKFDCITIHNTLHGKGHNEKELKLLFEFFKNHGEYIIISNPIINENLLDDFKLIHSFKGSHSNKSVFHKLYKC